MEQETRSDKDQECCEEVSTNKPTVVMYRNLMVECFEAASVVIELMELVPDRYAEIPADVRTRIALPIFDRVTRQVPEQEKIYALALEYVGFLIKEKEAEAKRSQEVRDSMGQPPFGRFSAAVPPCEHMPLLGMRNALMCGDELSPEGHQAIDALSLTRAPGPDVDVSIRRMVCPSCQAYVLSDMVKSGHLWRESRELKHGEPEGPSVSDTPLFEFELVDVLANGHPTMFIMKEDKRLEEMEVAEVIADRRFFGTIFDQWGEGLYVFMLWKKDMTLHSSHEFRVPPPLS